MSGCLVAAASGSGDSTCSVAPLSARPAIRSGSPTAASRRDRAATRRCGFVPVNDFRSSAVSCGSSVFQICWPGSSRARSIASRPKAELDDRPPPRSTQLRRRGRLVRRLARGRRRRRRHRRGRRAAAARSTTRRPRIAFTSPEQHAALRGAQARHQHLVIAAAEPAGREAARERKLHLARRPRSVKSSGRSAMAASIARR